MPQENEPLEETVALGDCWLAWVTNDGDAASLWWALSAFAQEITG